MKRWLALLTLFLTLSVAAQRRTDPQQYEKILLPLYHPAEGANGAQWQTKFQIANESNRSVDVFPLTPDCFSSVSCFRTVRGPMLGPHDNGFNTFIPGAIGTRDVGGMPGVFLYADRGTAVDLRFQLHVANVSRRPVALGTRVPVVRETEFFTGTTNVHAIPILAGTRAALRIYALDSQGPADVRITVHESSLGSRPIAEEIVRFVPPPANTCAFEFGCPQPFVYKPATIEITDLLARYPGLSRMTGLGHGIRIEIEPLTPGLAFWPMVSVTEVNTSVVTIYTAR
jgi:hypothetical protein